MIYVNDCKEGTEVKFTVPDTEKAKANGKNINDVIAGALTTITLDLAYLYDAIAKQYDEDTLITVLSQAIKAYMSNFDN